MCNLLCPTERACGSSSFVLYADGTGITIAIQIMSRVLLAQSACHDSNFFSAALVGGYLVLLCCIWSVMIHSMRAPIPVCCARVCKRRLDFHRCCTDVSGGALVTAVASVLASALADQLGLV